MVTIASADLLPILDSIGLADAARLAIADGTEAADISTSATHAVSDVLALTDIDQAAALAAGASAYKAAAAQPYATRAFLFQTLLNAVKTHVVNINTYLSGNTAKVSRKFATVWRSLYGVGSLLPANVFQDTVIIARTVTITGATTDTEVAGADLDTTLVAPANYELEVTTDIGGTTSVTLTMKKLGGSTETKVVALSASDDAGAKKDIGSGSDVYIGCASSAQTGGSSGAFKVQNKVLRVAAI